MSRLADGLAVGLAVGLSVKEAVIAGALDEVSVDTAQLPNVFDSDPVNRPPKAVSIPLTRIIYAPSP